MPRKPEIKFIAGPLGWRYQVLVAGHVIREDGNYSTKSDAKCAAEMFLNTKAQNNTEAAA